MTDLQDAQYRSRLLSDLIRQRTDETLRELVDGYDKPLDFQPLENFMICPKAWEHVAENGIRPSRVFAHPEVLSAHPTASQYYRGMALLSQKQVTQLAVSVADWETGARKRAISPQSAIRVDRVYNSVISSIITGSTDWTLENGYRSILATMGIRLDGMFRNKIGQAAERLIKTRVADRLRKQGMVVAEDPDGAFTLKQDTLMFYGSEPDIKFERNGAAIATVEIKGGKDPAGALERLGAMQKSFAETPPGCVNILIAGVVTPEMQQRLEQIGAIKVFLLDELASDGEQWDAFTQELFHHALRIA